MSKYKIAVISVYIGKLPYYFNNYLKSCSYNNDIDFYIFTDDKVDNVPSNVKIISITFDELKCLFKEKLEMNICLPYPYKCCDYKPCYGKIFSDYLKEYDFWGHSDLDMIFGDIRNYITDDLLSKNDKLLRWGHLSLYRNTKEVNDRYMLDGSKCGSYKEVFTNPQIFVFDELRGMYSIYEYNKFPMYDESIFADITFRHKRFCMNSNDYNNEIFYFENGHIYRDYFIDNKMNRDEFIYVHFGRRRKMYLNTNSDSFYICDKGFIERKKDDNVLDIISKYNRYPGKLVEKLELKIFSIKERIRKFKEKRRKF